MKRCLTLATLCFAVLAVWALVSVGGPSSSDAAHANSQVALTASYSINGGSGPGVQDMLTYVSNGAQQVVPLSGYATVYMADTGTMWSVQTLLTGSTYSERWVTAQDVSGTIGAPLTVSFSYYHQYLVNFIYNVTYGGTGFTGPMVSYFQMGAPASSVAPAVAWVDASSTYSYDSQLSGSNSNERWALASLGGGMVTQPATFSETYYHQFLVSSSFSIVGGGGPTPPSLLGNSFGTLAKVVMTSSTQTNWFDAAANYTFTSPLSFVGQSANETWLGTVLVQTQNGNVISTNNNGTVIGPLSVTPVFYHEYEVSVKFNFVGGVITGLNPPPFTYQHFGSKASVSSNQVVWVDSGTQYAVPANLCCTNSQGSERWVLNNNTSGAINSPTKIDPTYFHQFFDYFTYSIVGQQPPSPSGQPDLTYLSYGNAQHLTLLLTLQGFWTDANSTYSAAGTLPSSSTGSERWFASAATGITPIAASTTVIAYDQQYSVTMIGGGLPNEWVNAGGNATLTVPGVFGRSGGTGYRVTSYQIDSGAAVVLFSPTGTISITLSMNGPHTIQFVSVLQFQVSLDAGATGGLNFITAPTVRGDNYWYDNGSPVRVVLNATWGRAQGVGQRTTSISASGEQTIQVNTVGTIEAYSTSSLISPVSITTTSVTQYKVVLNAAALEAFSSVSPPSTFPNDSYWYDSGSPPVSITLNGAFSRSAGTGFRVDSWELDSEAVTKVAQAGLITIVTKPMTAAQFVNATVVTQYQVTFDAGGATAFYSITNPSIPLDSGWYDASSPVGLTMNGMWGRSAGVGHRLAGFSLNGGAEVAVASTHLVEVLNLTGISSPEAVTTSIVTQFQVLLDSGATSSLSSITPTAVPQDSYWYDSGTSVTVSLDGVWGRGATTGDRLVSYSVNQGAPTAVLSPSPVQVLSVSAISGPESITTKSQAQFRVTSPVPWVSITNATLPGDVQGWFDAGTRVTVVFGHAWNQTSTASRESVTSYTVNSGGKTSVVRTGNGTFTINLVMTQGQVIAMNSVTQYLLTYVGPPQVSVTPPSQTKDSYFDSGSKVTITVARVWNGSGPDARESLESYSVDGAPPTSVPYSNSSATFTTASVTFSGPRTLDFIAVAQYLVSFQFLDGPGSNPIVPSAVQVGVGNSTVDLQGPTLWLANGTSFTVVNVTWEGASVGPEPPPSYRMEAAPFNVTLETQVYQASLKVVDLFGLPVSGAHVSMTLVNGTTLTGMTKGDGVFSAGMIPVGTYTAKVSSMGTSAQIIGSANSVHAAAVGTVALSLVTLIFVIAAAAGGGSAGVLLLRKRKRSKGGAEKVSQQK